MRGDAARARDILAAIARIESRTQAGQSTFDADEMLQVWVIHHLEIIGVAAKGLSEEFRSAHPEIPWHNIAQMRDRLIHGYWSIDLEIVWAVVERDLPPLKATLRSDPTPG